MDLRKLEIFVRVAECKSFSKAAASLHMAQPAVSIAVRKLEESLGANLFDRRGRQVELTAEGRNLLQRAVPILRDVEALKQSTGAMSDLLLGELSITCPSMLATYYLPDLLGEFLAQYPGLTAAVTQAGTTRAEQMLLADEIEIGVTSTGASQRQDIERYPLLNEEMVLCVGAGHPWAGRGSVDLAELDNAPMVVYESGYYIRERLDALCADAGVEPDFRLQSNFLPLLVSMVRQGLGATVGLRMMAEQEPGLHGLALNPGVDVHMALAKRRGRTLSRANQAFLDWLGQR